MTSLRQRMLEDMRVRRLSPFTQRTYVETVARFARYFDRYPDRPGLEPIRAYLSGLPATERRLSTSSPRCRRFASSISIGSRLRGGEPSTT